MSWNIVCVSSSLGVNHNECSTIHPLREDGFLERFEAMNATRPFRSYGKQLRGQVQVGEATPLSVSLQKRSERVDERESRHAVRRSRPSRHGRAFLVPEMSDRQQHRSATNGFLETGARWREEDRRWNTPWSAANLVPRSNGTQAPDDRAARVGPPPMRWNGGCLASSTTSSTTLLRTPQCGDGKS